VTSDRFRRLSARMAICALTGFSSGMPFFVLQQLVPAWLTEAGVDLAIVGGMSLVALPYTWKFVWSPVLDRYAPPALGRRRGWALAVQVGLLLALASLGALDPTTGVMGVAAVAGLVALFSASQDVVLDAYRRELLPDEELGLGNAWFVNAYRLSSLVPGSLALILADHLTWTAVHATVAAFMLVGIVTTWAMPEPRVPTPPRTLRDAVVDPFRAFVGRNGPRRTALVLAFMLLYKLGDSMAAALLTPFWLDLGYTMTEIGTVAKGAALWSAVVGAFVGGAVTMRVGIDRALWLFGFFQLGTLLAFAAHARVGADPLWLFGVVSLDHLGAGLSTAAFVAFIARETDRRYTATQLALLTSLVGVPRTLAGATTGLLVQATGWSSFFLLCAAFAIPGLALLPLVSPWRTNSATVRTES